MDDAELQMALAADLDTAFEPLVLAYQDRLYRFGLRLAGNPQDAEEIAQDAFVRAYRALGQYPRERIEALALRSWLYQIALNVFRNRTRRRQPQSVMSNGHLEALHDPQLLPEETIDAGERAGAMASLLLALSQRYRTSIVLRHVEELSIAEIASIVEQPEGTVKSNIHRGLQSLRQALESEEYEVLR